MERIIETLKYDWQFARGEIAGAASADCTYTGWQTVRVPHDWAISGPFDPMNDRGNLIANADGTKVNLSVTGRTGALPTVGSAWYRREIFLDESLAGREISLEFDGVMSHSEVYVNGVKLSEEVYGYKSFRVDITGAVELGKSNLIAVHVSQFSWESRWYPGAGIYRNVRLVVKNAENIAYHSVYITTPEISAEKASVRVAAEIVHPADGGTLAVTIYDADGKVAASTKCRADQPSVTASLAVENPELWSDKSPYLYTAKVELQRGGIALDCETVRIGFRTLEFDKKRGFFVNGVYTKLNGVCMHHDMGAIGSAVNVSALRRQFRILAEMGCNSIRTSHNPPAPELLDLADELGFYIIDEQFDQWRHNKTANGYGLYFNEHAEADFVATLRRDRNHPSIIMWSLGNEIHDQSHADGGDTARWLAEIVRREDPTRPTTCGFDRPDDAWKNGLITAVDIVGLNYKPYFYQKFLDLFDMPIYGSENESCVSSRGVYYIPNKISAAEAKGDKDIDVKPWKFYPGVEIPAPCRETTDVSSYDLSAPPWAYYPEVEFAAQDDYPQIFGEYVWTGFDYLGEPTPYGSYGTGTKLTRSSYFGIVDLAGLPKDRYWSYQAKWTDKPVLHVFPHWNWEIGDVLPVHCYTSASRAELFVNGRSMGIREKNPAGNELERFRLIWDDIAFEPGEITVKAYDDAGNVIMRETIRTAGAPAKLELLADREVYAADGDDLCYVTVRVLDAEGNFCPKAATRLHFTADGCGEFLASDNGDQTDTEVFPSAYRNAFSGMAVGIFRTKCGCRGDLRIRVEADGMEPAVLNVKVR